MEGSCKNSESLSRTSGAEKSRHRPLDGLRNRLWVGVVGNRPWVGVVSVGVVSGLWDVCFGPLPEEVHVDRDRRLDDDVVKPTGGCP